MIAKDAAVSELQNGPVAIHVNKLHILDDAAGCTALKLLDSLKTAIRGQPLLTSGSLAQMLCGVAREIV